MSLYGINAYNNSNYYSTLLSSKNQTSSSGNSSLTNMLNSATSKKSSSSSDVFEFMKGIAKTDSSSDLMTLAKNIDLVRSKGYGKKMTEEYKKIFSGQSTDSSSSSSSSSAKSIELGLSKNAKSLSSAASKLVSGNAEYYNNAEGLLAGVKDFVNSYNSTIDGLKDSQSTLALQKGVSMVSTSAAYSKSLSKIGISVGKDNKLSIDENAFAKADVNNVKSLFSGSYSFASKTAEKANYIDRVAQVQANTTYNSQGKANSFYENAMINSMYSKLF